MNSILIMFFLLYLSQLPLFTRILQNFLLDDLYKSNNTECYVCIQTYNTLSIYYSFPTGVVAGRHFDICIKSQYSPHIKHYNYFLYLKKELMHLSKNHKKPFYTQLFLQQFKPMLNKFINIVITKFKI